MNIYKAIAFSSIFLCSCYKPISKFKDQPSKYIFLCQIEKKSYIIMSDSCDTTYLSIDRENNSITLHLIDCKNGTIHFEKKHNSTITTEGNFTAINKKKTQKFMIESKNLPGSFIKVRARATLTRMQGEWKYYDSTGLLIKTEKYK